MQKLLQIPNIELAKLLGVTPAYISHIRHGRKRLSDKQALKIHEAYGIPLWELKPETYPKKIFDNSIAQSQNQKN